MNATEKNTMAIVLFFVLIIWMAIYYSTVLQKRMQTPLSYFETPTTTDRVAGLN